MPDPTQPTNRQLVAVLDLGTTGVKALLVDRRGKVWARVGRPVATASPEPGIAEQDSDAVVAAAESALVELLACGDEPLALALSSAMHGVVAVDPEDRALMPLLTWADERGAREASELRDQGRASGLLSATGTPVHASSPLCKLAWLRRERPGVFAAAARFVGIKELLCARWLGEHCIDESVASATGLFDLRQRAWSPEALALAGLEPARLSTLASTDGLLRNWREDVARRMGWPPGSPVVLGATDGVLATIGVGVESNEAIAVTLGTSGAARAICREPNAGDGLFCYVLDRDRFVFGGAVNNVGLALDWVGRTLLGATEDIGQAVVRAAARSEPGARGVVWEPYLTGERFPDYDSYKRAAFRGMSLAHGRDDLCRAAVEGVLRSVVAVVDALRARVPELAAAELRLGGGLAESPELAQWLADLAGAPVVVSESVEASGLGAARLAFFALDGRWPSFDQNRKNVSMPT